MIKIPFYILDTDCISLFQRSDSIIQQRVNSLDFQEIATTIVTVEEQVRGSLKMVRRASSSTQQIAAYARLQATLRYFQTIQVLDFTAKASDICEELIQQKDVRKIGTRDLRIAAIAISVNGIVVTRNRRHFEQVPNLTWEDWTISGP